MLNELGKMPSESDKLIRLVIGRSNASYRISIKKLE